MKSEDAIIVEAIRAARTVQEFLWGHADGDWGFEEWKLMLQKRFYKLDAVRPGHPHATVEVRKRLLQLTALGVALLRIIDERGVPWPKDATTHDVKHVERAVKNFAEFVERIERLVLNKETTVDNQIVPSVGRVVHCYWPEKWEGPRPGMIVRVWGDTPDACCQVNVQLDGVNDERVLAEFRGRSEGNTLSSVRIYAERPALGREACWCEWIPFQKGQAALTAAIAEKAGIKA